MEQTIVFCRLLCLAARKRQTTKGDGLPHRLSESKRVVQIGLQQRSWEHYITVKKDVIDTGMLGQVTFIRTYWYRNHNAGGGGAMTDLFVHWVDVAQWYMGADMPTRATATGVKALLQQRQTPDSMSAALSYPSAVVEVDSALLGYIEGGGMMVRGTGVWTPDSPV